MSKPESKLSYERWSVGQSVLVSSSVWSPRPDFYYYQTFAGLLMWGDLSDERTALWFTTDVGPRQSVLLGSDSHGTHDHILLFQTRGSPNLEGQVSVFISPRNRVALLYPQALGSPFAASTTRWATVEVFQPVSTQGRTVTPETASTRTANL
jgi:hypothetical protein